MLGPVMDRHLEQMTEGLGLDSGQQATIRDAHELLFPAIREAHKDVEALRDEAAGIFSRGVGSPDAFRAHVRQLQRSQARLDSLLTEVLLAELAVLDADQRDRYIRISPWSRRPGAPPPKKGPPPR
jgi:hypothetical protein